MSKRGLSQLLNLEPSSTPHSIMDPNHESSSSELNNNNHEGNASSVLNTASSESAEKKVKLSDSESQEAHEPSESTGITNNNNNNNNNNGNTDTTTGNNNWTSSGQTASGNSSASVNSGPAGPSRVVHVRNIPNEANESDLINLGAPFGKLSNYLLLKGKNQGFIEFSDISSAQVMVSYWSPSNTSHPPPTVRGRHVFVQYSNHQQLKASSNSDSVNNNSNHHGSSFGNRNSTGFGGPDGGVSSSESSVLRVVVESQVYPVLLDTFYQLFSRFGKVQKIVTFTKNASLQALVQFSDLYSASSAKTSLDGQSMFGGSSNILRVDFSKLTNLNVKYNNDKSRDYTNPSLPAGPGQPVGPNSGPVGYPGSAATGSSGYGTGSAGGPHHAAGDHMAVAAAMGLGHNPMDPLGMAGSTGGSTAHAGHHGGMGPSGAGSHHLGFSSSGAPPPPSMMGYGGGAGSNRGGANHHGPPHHHGSRNDHQNQMMQQHQMAAAQHAMMGFGAVLLVSNLPEQLATPDALFTLFGVYGDVVRVKVLFNKKDNALIQMAEAHQASIALQHLDKMKLFGKIMRVTSSKHGVVQLPKEGQPDSGLTKDYSNSPLHRFKKPGSKNYSNIYAPSQTLHLSNIPATIDEEGIKQVFAEVLPNGSDDVVGFKFFPKDRKMALIQLPTIEASVIALIKLHNHQLGESSHLRVSFSKSNL